MRRGRRGDRMGWEPGPGAGWLPGETRRRKRRAGEEALRCGEPSPYRNICGNPRKGARRSAAADTIERMALSLLSKRTRILLSFGCVYLFWGGTFLAMRYGVEVMSPFLLSTFR